MWSIAAKTKGTEYSCVSAKDSVLSRKSPNVEEPREEADIDVKDFKDVELIEADNSEDHTAFKGSQQSCFPDGHGNIVQHSNASNGADWNVLIQNIPGGQAFLEDGSKTFHSGKPEAIGTRLTGIATEGQVTHLNPPEEWNSNESDDSINSPPLASADNPYVNISDHDILLEDANAKPMENLCLQASYLPLEPTISVLHPYHWTQVGKGGNTDPLDMLGIAEKGKGEELSLKSWNDNKLYRSEATCSSMFHQSSRDIFEKEDKWKEFADQMNEHKVAGLSESKQNNARDLEYAPWAHPGAGLGMPAANLSAMPRVSVLARSEPQTVLSDQYGSHSLANSNVTMDANGLLYFPQVLSPTSVVGLTNTEILTQSSMVRRNEMNGGARYFRCDKMERRASKYCHICGLASARRRAKGCANFREAGGYSGNKCTKIVCEKCLLKRLGMSRVEVERVMGDEKWLCTHCRNSCPGPGLKPRFAGARCFSYQRVNARRGQRLKPHKRERTKLLPLEEKQSFPGELDIEMM